MAQSFFTNPLILFPILLILSVLYYTIFKKFQWGFLLIISLSFYFWAGKSAVLILAFSILFNYFLARLIGKIQGRQRLVALLVGIILNLGILVLFKYGLITINALLSAQMSFPDISTSLIFPIGLSFFTLQNIGYLVDVYKKIIPVEQNLGVFAVYISFFPKIIAGPIERAKNLIPQVRLAHRYDSADMISGTRQIVFGLFKKVVIADRLAMVANEVFDKPGEYQGLAVFLGILFFAFQLYFDFSGYSDIAIGMGRLFGYKFTTNFKRPYLSEDIVEFWNRWHVSLSAWLRDYIFYPTRRYFLKHSPNFQILALIIPPLLTMLGSGFWHGSGWTYILWGLYHGILYIFVMLRKKYFGWEEKLNQKWLTLPKILINFGFISSGWVLFRASSLESALILFKNLFVKNFSMWPLLEHVSKLDLVLSVLLIAFSMLFEILMESRIKDFGRLPCAARWAIYGLLLIGISVLGVYQASNNPFVYAKF